MTLVRHFSWRAWCAVLISAAPRGASAECMGPTVGEMKQPPYPAAAVALRAQGRAMVHVWLDADGKVVNAAIGESSGNDLLDKTAIESVSTWRYAPRVCDGRKVASDAIVPLEFRLDSSIARPSQIEADKTPWYFVDAVAALRYLRSNKDVEMDGSRSLDATTTLTHYSVPRERATFRVVEWTGSETGDAFASILRERFVEREGAYAIVYSHICSGSAQWCERMEEAQVTLLKNSLPAEPMP